MEQKWNMMGEQGMPVYPYLLTSRRPDAVAAVRGGPDHKGLWGGVRFWQSGAGMVVSPWIEGLPPRAGCEGGIYALHIHQGTACAGTEEKPFAQAEGHLNPAGCPHPAHAGDLPPLFADQRGSAWYAVMTDRLTVEEAVGHVVIIHAGPDDFKTQPSGNAGEMIACGEIRPYGED